MTDIKIDDELREWIVSLTDEERGGLEASILEEGCRDPLVVWEEEGVLLDGHHRYDICQKHGIDFDVTYKSLASREEAKDWIVLNQLNRRNLTPQQAAYLRGKLYQSWKHESPNPTGKNQYDQEVGGKNYHQPRPKKTAETIAETSGVSERTVREDAKYAESVDAIGEKEGSDVREQILSGKAKTTKSEVVQKGNAYRDPESESTNEKTEVDTESEQLKSVSTRIPMSLHSQLKAHAQYQGVKLHELVKMALEEYVSTHEIKF